jgi:hypothetical protein
MIDALLNALRDVALAEGEPLGDGAAEELALRYLSNKVATVFNVTVPARSAVRVHVPMPEPVTARSIAFARAIGLLSGYKLCEKQLDDHFSLISAARKLVDPLAQFASREDAATPPTIPAGLRERRDERERLLQRVTSIAGIPPGMASLTGEKRRSALLTAVTSVLAPVLADREIAELIDDGQGDSMRMRTDRVYRRRKATEAWTSRNFEGFVVASVQPVPSAE